MALVKLYQNPQPPVSLVIYLSFLDNNEYPRANSLNIRNVLEEMELKNNIKEGSVLEAMERSF